MLRRRPLRPAVALCIITLVFLNSLVLGQAVSARQPADRTVPAFLIATTATSAWRPPSPDPSGITYSPAQDRLLIVDGEVDEVSFFTGANIFVSTRNGTLTSTGTTIPWAAEPVGITVHPLTQHVFISDDDKKSIFEVGVGPDARLGTADDIIRSFSTSMYDNNDPEGLTFDDTGTLYLTNDEGAKVHRITPGANGIFDGPPPAGDDLATSWPTRALGQPQPEGIDYHNGLLYIVSNSKGSPIAEVTLDGKLVRTISLANVMPVGPADLTWAPASTGSDVEHIYLVARGVDNNTEPGENDGKVYELAIPDTTILLPLIITAAQG